MKHVRVTLKMINSCCVWNTIIYVFFTPLQSVLFNIKFLKTNGQGTYIYILCRICILNGFADAFFYLKKKIVYPSCPFPMCLGYEYEYNPIALHWRPCSLVMLMFVSMQLSATARYVQPHVVASIRRFIVEGVLGALLARMPLVDGNGAMRNWAPAARVSPANGFAQNGRWSSVKRQVEDSLRFLENTEPQQKKKCLYLKLFVSACQKKNKYLYRLSICAKFCACLVQ